VSEREAIEQALLGFLREQLNVRDPGLHRDTALFTSGWLDSFSLVALLGFVETRFGVRLTGQLPAATSVDSVGALARYVSQHTGPRPPLAGRLALVTAADAAYFTLLQSLIRSVHAAAPPGAGALCVIDVGLTPAQRRWTEAHADRVVDGRWDLDFPNREATPRHVQALTCRPFLPAYFPGADVYVWLDADAWVQEWDAVALFVRACEDLSIAVCPEVDRAYSCFYDRGGAQRWWHACYARAFGGHVANQFWRHPGISAGAFAAKAASPAWQVWAEYLQQGLQRTVDAVDQTALAVAIYREAVASSFVPAEAHWLCQYARPRVDAETGHLLHPMPPHRRLGILHLAGVWPKHGPATLLTTGGDAITRWLTFEGVPIR
jgi:acyl carrier protein